MPVKGYLFVGEVENLDLKNVAGPSFYSGTRILTYHRQHSTHEIEGMVGVRCTVDQEDIFLNPVRSYYGFSDIPGKVSSTRITRHMVFRMKENLQVPLRSRRYSRFKMTIHFRPRNFKGDMPF